MTSRNPVSKPLQRSGAIHMVQRSLHGKQEVSGSNPDVSSSKEPLLERISGIGPQIGEVPILRFGAIYADGFRQWVLAFDPRAGKADFMCCR